MVSPEPESQGLNPRTPPSIIKTTAVRQKHSFVSDFLLFLGGAFLALFLVWTLYSFSNPNPNPNFISSLAHPNPKINSPTKSLLPRENPQPNFYDDPTLTYTIGSPVQDWDEKRAQWFHHHPDLAIGSDNRVLILTGSQPKPCQNPIGDHLLLRLFKNKVDYARISGYDVFYSNSFFHPKMKSYWTKLPLVRAAMVAHPEVEWIWWVDSDAAFTDMDFRLPLAKYRDHNLIVHGWPNMVYDNRSWVSINAGVFLIRNCQWSMDFLEVWAQMGPQTSQYDQWGKTLRATLPDKLFPESDDQSALVYLLLKEKEKWADRIYLENEYYFEGYWVEIVGTLANVTDRYVEMERRVRSLRRRHAEKLSADYGEMEEEYVKEWGSGKGGRRRPFITHFTGCQPCSGDHNQMYTGQSCWDGMRRVLNFADDQVLRSFGFKHVDPFDPTHVSPLPFDYPA